MKLHFEFDNLDQIDEFAEAWFRGRVEQAERNYPQRVVVHNTVGSVAISDKSDPRDPDTRPITAEGALILPESQDAPQPVSAATGEAPNTDPVSVTKRKRRTKAEIAADEAAANVVQVLVDVQSAAATELTKLNQAADNARGFAAAVTAGVSADIAALAATIDGSDKMAHMNEGRDFIAKHGFPKYNETFALADVPANIAAHTPEQAALHRAAMQWLIAQAHAQ